MSASELRSCLLAAAGALEAARDELCRLDAVAGDGDHGVTMTLAARAVRQRLESNPQADGAELLRQAALGMGSVGGAIGPIYATALLRIAVAVQSLPSTFTMTDVRSLAETGMAAIATLSRAKPGDKTIVDAIAPAVDAVVAAEASGEPLESALPLVVEAARKGAESTAEMVATIGRASRFGERSRGWADPGATSFAVVLKAFVGAYLARQSATGRV